VTASIQIVRLATIYMLKLMSLAIRRLLLAVVLLGIVSATVLRGSSCVVFGSDGIIVVKAGQSIAEAVNEASAGDTVFVKSGFYSESAIVVDKAVSIVGESAVSTVVDGGGTAQVLFQVVASDVLIENLTLQNTNTAPLDQAPAIRVYDAAGVRIQNVSVLSATVGVELRSSNSTEIAYCEISESSSAGIYLRDGSDNSVIVGNTIANNTRGIVFADTASQFNRIYHNNFENNTQQLWSFGGVNHFDDGYPSGGNYWSDFQAVDFKNGVNQDQNGSDGILDGGFSSDNYPLANPASNLGVQVNGTEFVVEVSSNVTVATWSFDVSGKSLNLLVGGQQGATSAFRMEIPIGLLSCGNLTSWVVSFGNNGSEKLQYLPMQDAMNTYLYFTHSGGGEGEIRITGTTLLPELSLLTTFTILLFATALACGLAWKRSHASAG